MSIVIIIFIDYEILSSIDLSGELQSGAGARPTHSLGVSLGRRVDGHPPLCLILGKKLVVCKIFELTVPLIRYIMNNGGNYAK